MYMEPLITTKNNFSLCQSLETSWNVGIIDRSGIFVLQFELYLLVLILTPKCATLYQSHLFKLFHTEFMNRSWYQAFVDWLKRNEIDSLFRTLLICWNKNWMYTGSTTSNLPLKYWPFQSYVWWSGELPFMGWPAWLRWTIEMLFPLGSRYQTGYCHRFVLDVV